MWGSEPDGTGRHRVRVAGVEAPHGVAESAGVPGVSGEAGEPGGLVLPPKRRGRPRGKATEVPVTARGEPGPRLVGTARDLGEIPAAAGSDAGATRAVPGAGGALPLSGPAGAVRGASALPGLRVGAGGAGGGLRAVFERGLGGLRCATAG